MTSEEIDRSLTPDRWKRFRAAARRAPNLRDPDAPDFSEQMEREIKRRGRPKKTAHKKTISIRLFEYDLATLRASGKGWQTRVSDFIAKSVKSGAL
jgi:uncharacterized protein (DUF4415 family)